MMVPEDYGSSPASTRASRLEGHFDAVTEQGFVEGWAVCHGDPRPCHVRVIHQDALLAEAFATRFRWDLLQLGKSHGHVAFRARLLQPIGTGPQDFSLLDVESGTYFPGQQHRLVNVPELAEPHQVCPEDLTREPAEWRDDEILARLDVLKLDENCALIGPVRFVDVLFMYVVSRRADPEGLAAYAAALNEGRITPNEIFQAVAESPERKAQKRALPSPHDARFPFLI